jgi:hypothetical protein
MNQKFKRLRVLSVIIILIGVALLIYMIKAEDEPGALPLFLILVGTIGFIVNQLKNTSKKGAVKKP